MDYKIDETVKLIEMLLEMNQFQLSKTVDVNRKTFSFANKDGSSLDVKTVKKLYDYAFERGVYPNQITIEYYIDGLLKGDVLLYHASKKGIVGDINPRIGKVNNDFGQGFYCGTGYDQPISLVSNYPNASLYLFYFHTKNLKFYSFTISNEWMLAIAYFRGKLEKYNGHPVIQEIVNKVKKSDYVIAPIADNRMFRIIDSFIDGEITDEQCAHCLAASNLGMQYVLLTDKAIKNLKPLEKLFVCDKEKEMHLKQKAIDNKDAEEKVKDIKIKYRGVGHYIDELFK